MFPSGDATMSHLAKNTPSALVVADASVGQSSHCLIMILAFGTGCPLDINSPVNSKATPAYHLLSW